ncbi:uncharacterized protein A1O9_09196 [Exophiala aquamarina CBS 119918]|uniref:Uncharacterized protein n=1 Tax=Exophiala aquamarina CBS 119918 TaxID=1182545 RepID=A0A072P3R5_9EURO|nr:uncharacterized protein A1O9_09196 [Exophiala aquamarina CBS 119918]KEF54754.1 hypothetical protein A1O9_09196 [Exophiala aquamarina CBS 119918]
MSYKQDPIELTSPYAQPISDPYQYEGLSHQSLPSRAPLDSLHRKRSSAGGYNPIHGAGPPDHVRYSQHIPQQIQEFAEDRFQPRSKELAPGRIGKFGADLLLEIVVCAFAVLVTVPFLWLAVAMSKYHHEGVTESRSNFIKQSTATASTLFTILFAAVLGSTLKRLATWRLQNGIRLGLLEQIMQSRTVFAALTTMVSFRALNLTAFILFFAWAFSPLGSQASLRLISTGTLFTEDSSLVSHVDTISNNLFDSVSGVSSLLTSLKPSYVSCVLGPSSLKASSMDLYGNPRIPWLRTDVEKDENGWQDLSKVNLTEGSYSSLVGVRVAPLANRNSSFVIETSYVNLDCEKPKNGTLVDISFNVTAGINGTFSGPNTTVGAVDSGIYPSWQVAMDQYVSNAYFWGYPELLANSSDADIPQGTMLWQTPHGPWESRCKISQEYVESNVSCYSIADVELPNCAVTSQRVSPKRHAPSTVTIFSFASTFSSMSSAWILATDPLTSSGYSSLSEYYLQNTSASFILSGNGRYYADYTNVTAEEFSQRLGQLLNSWALGSQISADTMQYSLDYQNTTVFYREGRPVYICSWAWLAVYCIGIAVMFTAALLSIYCAFNTTIPDILSYCSTLTRDSRFFSSATGGSTLDGLVRAKILQDVEIRLGEVADQSENSLSGRDGFQNSVPGDQGPRYLAIAPPEYLRPPQRGTIYA